MLQEDLQILYLFKKLCHLSSKEQKKKFLHSIHKNEFGKVIHFWRSGLLKGRHDEQITHATYVVRQILTEFSSTDHYLENITPEEVNAVAEYMEKTKRFEDCMNIIDILYLQRGVHTITKGGNLFSTLVRNFEFLESDQVREIVTENLIELMRENQSFIKVASHPYYFMEYLLHLINQQENTDKVIYWFEIIKQFYIIQDSEKYLFHENDFRILVDVLVRHIENYNTQKELITYLETYLVLSISPFIFKHGKCYKLDQIMLVINDIPSPSQAIRGYAEELRSLQTDHP